MTTSIDAAFHFTDMAGLGALRREANAESPEALRAVAQQFEAMFLNLMLKEMRASVGVDGGLFDRDQLAFQESMFDQQLSLSLSRGRGIGIADAILRDLGGQLPPGRDSDAGPHAAHAGAAAGRVSTSAGVSSPPASLALSSRIVSSRTPIPHSASAQRASVMRDFTPETPEDFVAALWPHARRAGAALGVEPEVLVAQAALETGWGRHMIRDGQGQSSLNLFGVKAGASWQGERTRVATLEFVNGVPERRHEQFRVYGSLRESFDDYVAVVGGLTRYAPALAAGNAEGYLRGLQAGGYATDPDYADKILAILARGLPGHAPEASSPQVVANIRR